MPLPAVTMPCEPPDAAPLAVVTDAWCVAAVVAVCECPLVTVGVPLRPVVMPLDPLALPSAVADVVCALPWPDAATPPPVEPGWLPFIAVAVPLDMVVLLAGDVAVEPPPGEAEPCPLAVATV